jgi:hypothetical protein
LKSSSLWSNKNCDEKSDKRAKWNKQTDQAIDVGLSLWEGRYD